MERLLVLPGSMLLFSSSAVHIETDELPVAQQLSEISKISNLLIFSGAMCNTQLYFLVLFSVFYGERMVYGSDLALYIVSYITC